MEAQRGREKTFLLVIFLLKSHTLFSLLRAGKKYLWQNFIFHVRFSILSVWLIFLVV